MPADIKASLAKTYRVLWLANIIVPLAIGLLYFLIDVDASMFLNEILQISLMTVEYVNLFLQIISAGYLGIAINNIRKFVSTQANTCQLLLHFTILSCYLTGLTVTLIFFTLVYLFAGSKEAYYLAGSVNILLQTLTYLTMCFVLLQLSNQEKVVEEPQVQAVTQTPSEDSEP